MANPLFRRGIIAGMIAMLVLLLVIALLVVITGAYNVAATQRHLPTVGWALDTTMHNSVQAHAEEERAPERFTPAMVAAGASKYKAMCQHCHGGIGKGRAEWAKGMRPHPPALAKAADQWTAAEVFWIVKHGIKMTGMPAFGPTHENSELWNIAAFVKALPQMSAAEYAAYTGGSHDGGGHSGGGHSH